LKFTPPLVFSHHQAAEHKTVTALPQNAPP